MSPIRHPIPLASASQVSRPPTAAEALALIGTWGDLSVTRRRELAVAVRLLGRITGRQLEAIALTPETLGPAIFGAPAARLGITQGSLYTYRNSLRAVLRRLRIIDSRAQGSGQFRLGAWTDLLMLAGDRHATIALTRFARWCDGRGLAPDAVTSDVVAEFINDLGARHLVRSPREHAAALVRTWNRCAQTRPGWPSARLALPPTDRRYTLAWEKFPKTLQADVKAFHARLTARNRSRFFTAAAGPPQPLRPATIRRRMDDLRYAAGALVRSGTAPRTVKRLADMLAPDNLAALLDWLDIRGGCHDSAHLGSIAATLQVVARHHLKLDSVALQEVEDLLAQARPPKQKTMTEKNAARLRALENPRSRAALLHLPTELMRRAQALEAAGQVKRAAWLASIAAAIEILISCPIRLHNLAHLRIGAHLQRAPLARAPFTDIIIPEEETKNGVRIEWPLSADTARLLATYSQRYRPSIAKPGSDWLFPGRDTPDRPRAPIGFSAAIAETIEDAIGVRVHPHLFRALAAAITLEASPGAIEEVRQQLGHRTMHTALTYYMTLNPRAAARRLDERVARQRKESRIAAGAFFRKGRS